VAVDLDDSPLGTGTKQLLAPVPSTESVNTSQGPTHRRQRKASLSARTWLAMQSSVTSVLSAAASLQHVRVTRTVETLTATNCTKVAPTINRSPSETSSGYEGPLPSGWRAQRNDVTTFTSSAPHADVISVPYLVFHLVETENTRRSCFTPPLSRDLPAQDFPPSHTSTSPSTTIPSTYYDADRHIFNANPLHLLSRAQINSWRFRGAPGAMPAQVHCRPELFYRLEPASGSLWETKGGSALKWGWRVVWDTDDPMEC
jgi:hypothetical protein